MSPKSTKNPLKNPSKIHEKSSKIELLGGSWGVLWSSWRHLGRILAPRANKSPKNFLFGPPGTSQEAPKIHQKFIKIRSGGLPESNRFFDRFWDHVLMPFGSNIAPTWSPKASQNRPKMLPKSIKKEIKMLTKFFLELWSFVSIFEPILDRFFMIF